jgi:hypothetical protein
MPKSKEALKEIVLEAVKKNLTESQPVNAGRQIESPQPKAGSN